MRKTTSLHAFLFLSLSLSLIFQSGAAPQAQPIPVTRSFAGDGSRAKVLPAAAWSADFNNFRAAVTDGDSRQVTGVYVPSAFSYPVVQQPDGQINYVSDNPGVVTQFGAASSYGTIGLLAHNNLAGEAFYQMAVGETFFILYGDGRVSAYWIQAVRVFQALTPSSPFSQFIDQEHPNARLSSSQVFAQIYTHPDQVVLQTCLGRSGDPSWGRIFVIGTPRSMQQVLKIPFYQAALLN